MTRSRSTALRHSIVRRSVGVMAFYVAGHAFNYLLLITTNRTLDPAIFSLFYIAISLINVLVTPGLTVVWSLTQHLSTVAAALPASGVIVELKRNLRALLTWGTAAVIIVGGALVLVARLIGVDSFAIVALVPCIALASLAVELMRGVFQALQRFVWFGALWVLWCALQYAFAMAGLVALDTVWAGLMGLLLAALASAGLGYLAMTRAQGERLETLAEKTDPGSLNAKRLVPLVSGYGLFTFLGNTDVLLAYLLFDRDRLAAYVASSILPKAIVTVTVPVAQVLLPVVITRAQAAESTRLPVIKALAIVIAVAAAGAAVLKASGGLVCNSHWGLRFCDPNTMLLLALAAAPLSVLRILVVSSLAHGRHWHPLIQMAGVVLVVGAAFALHSQPYELALIYVAACSAVALAYIAIDWLRTPAQATPQTIE